MGVQEGEAVGFVDGRNVVGISDGFKLGTKDGATLSVGSEVGEGDMLGPGTVGATVGLVGIAEGFTEGFTEGTALGLTEGT